MPVSTDDLTNFVTDKFQGYRNVENEENYYHGRVYLLAEGEGNGSARLYLDANAPLFSQLSGQLKNAARLGLVFRDGDTVTARWILSLSQAANKDASEMNTVLDGIPIKEGNVLHSSGNDITAVPDPAIFYTSFAADYDSTPEKTLCTLAFNKTCTVDIYFYLEGCDPDCLNEIQLNSGDLGLCFFALPG